MNTTPNDKKMTPKENNAISAFMISSFMYIVSVIWIFSDEELDMSSKAIISIFYVFIVGLATLAAYDLSEDKKPKQ